jgi:NADPH2:quinone reductase
VVRVRAASLKAVDRQMAGGSHYASPRELPAVCGIDGVGELDDGTRVFFGGPRRPFGAMAERTVAPRAFCFPVPSGIDDETAAALPNPGVSAWLSLTHRAKLAPGETVLILGATGVTGQLAVQIAKLLGAKRVIGAGRNERAPRSTWNTMGMPSRRHSCARQESKGSTSLLITCGDGLRRRY